MGAVTRSVIEAVASLEYVADDDRLLERCAMSASLMTEALRNGHRVWFCGNGGSAAEAQHLAAELSGRFLLNRPALPAEALHVNTSYLTAVANDFGYEATFARLLDGVATEGDVLVCLSTSGNSRNVVEAARTARRQGIRTIALTGPGGGQLAVWADVVLDTPAEVSATSRIQEVHLLLGHTLCELVEAQLFGAPDGVTSPGAPSKSRPPMPDRTPHTTDPALPSRSAHR